MLTRSEAYRFINSIIELRKNISDELALTVINIYPEWKVNKGFEVGERIKYNGKLYKVLATHSAIESWKPDTAPTVFEPINVENTGTLNDPIEAAVGMLYHKDKYYIENGVIYLCIRDDTGNGTQLYHMPSALVGTYFEIIQ